jgi:glycerophosphoryl diester phosphodiesterase
MNNAVQTSESVRTAEWLFSRPIAHRGLHDEQNGIIENSITAFKNAADNGFNFETDLYLLKDGKIAAFHDLT